MWYFAWILGLGFAVLLAVVSAIWVEFEKGRLEAFSGKNKKDTQHNDNITASKNSGDNA